MAFARISVYWQDNSCGKCKKTKTFGLVLLFHLPGRVAHFVRNPALPTDQPLRGSWRDSHFFTYPVLFKRHGILSRTHVYLHPCTFPFFHLFTSSPFHLFTSSPSYLFTSSPFHPFIFSYSTTINSMSTMPFGVTRVLTVRLLLPVFGINGL